MRRLALTPYSALLADPIPERSTYPTGIFLLNSRSAHHPARADPHRLTMRSCFTMRNANS